MNRTKKYVILILSIAMLTVVLIGGSWAYFTDSDESKNIVTMGHVQISLDEPEFEKITKNTYHQDDVMPDHCEGSHSYDKRGFRGLLHQSEDTGQWL